VGEVKFWEAGSTVGWSAIAQQATRSGVLNSITGARMLAYLSLAQYNAAVAAEGTRTAGNHPSTGAAIAGASAVVLSAFLPLQAAFFEAQVRAQENGEHWPGEAQQDFAAGEAIGRQVGAAVLASAATDGFTPSNAGVTVPVCPGCWFSAPGLIPGFSRLGEMRPFFLTSGSQFRLGPPPSFGSPAFLAALAEVRLISDTRTTEQDAVAKFWNVPNGFVVIPAYNYEIASGLIVRYRLNELRAAHVLALMGMTLMDALIASHDSKFTYWLLRPHQADPGITTSVPVPNFPSYPSNHSAVSAGDGDSVARVPQRSERADRLGGGGGALTDLGWDSLPVRQRGGTGTRADACGLGAGPRRRWARGLPDPVTNRASHLPVNETCPPGERTTGCPARWAANASTSPPPSHSRSSGSTWGSPGRRSLGTAR
jgi:hypothetical protein